MVFIGRIVMGFHLSFILCSNVQHFTNNHVPIFPKHGDIRPVCISIQLSTIWVSVGNIRICKISALSPDVFQTLEEKGISNCSIFEELHIKAEGKNKKEQRKEKMKQGVKGGGSTP